MPNVGNRGLAALRTAGALAGSSLWRSLSVAPTLTRAGLLKCLAYGSLFFVVVFYPVGAGARSDERKFRRALVLIVLACRYGRRLRRTDRAGVLEREDPVVLRPEGLGCTDAGNSPGERSVRQSGSLRQLPGNDPAAGAGGRDVPGSAGACAAL